MTQKKDDYFSLWVPLSVLFGVTLAGLAMLFAGAQSSAEFVSDYQILIGAGVAILSAFWTIKAHIKTSNDEIEVALRTASEQIRSSQLIEESRREEKLRAARAMLPFALTEISTFCDNTIADLSELMKPMATDPIADSLVRFTAGPRFQMRPLPVSALDRMRELIENSPRDIAIEMGRLLSNMQIYTSRLSDIESWNQSGFSGEGKSQVMLDRAIEVFELCAQINRFFDYGRFRSEVVRTGPTDRSEIISIAKINKTKLNCEKLDILIQRRFQNHVAARH
jgi:hypothetical protein